MSYIGNQPTTAAFPFDQFSGNGTTTAFTLTYAPAGATSIIVTINGVTQNPNLYSVVGSTLNFSPAPPVGINNIAVLYLGLPVIGTTLPGNTGFMTTSSFTATAGQTLFTPSGSYTPNLIQVYRNGAQLAPADYTATNGVSVTLNNGCVAGDVVVIQAFALATLTNALPTTGGTVTGPMTFNSSLAFGSSGAYGTSGQLLQSNGNAAPSWTTLVVSPIPNISTAIYPSTVTNSTGTPMVNTGTGTFTFTVPAGCTAVRITATGGGGSGQTGPGGGLGGNGGGAGGTVIKRQAVTAGQVLTITVGVGGTGSLGSGGNTTVVNAGLSLSVTAGGAAGQSGGSASGGDLNMLGATAGYGFEGNSASLCNGRDGADSYWGGGGGGAALGSGYGNSGQGFPARGYGSGGGGGSPGNAGGTGMTGIVYIEY